MKIKAIQIAVIIIVLVAVACILAACPGELRKAENDVSEHNQVPIDFSADAKERKLKVYQCETCDQITVRWFVGKDYKQIEIELIEDKLKITGDLNEYNCSICEPAIFKTEVLHQEYHEYNYLDTFEVAYVDTFNTPDGPE